MKFHGIEIGKRISSSSWQLPMKSRHISIPSSKYVQLSQTILKTGSRIPAILIPCEDLKYSSFNGKLSSLLSKQEMKREGEKEMKKSSVLPDSKYLKRRYLEFDTFGLNRNRQVEQSLQKRTCWKTEDDLEKEMERGETKEAKEVKETKETKETKEIAGQEYSFTECKMDGRIDTNYPENTQKYIFSTIGTEFDQEKSYIEKKAEESQYSFSECSSSTPIHPSYENSTIYPFSECLFCVC